MYKVKKYGATWCKYCDTVDALLKELNIPYEDIDVDDPEHFEECRNFNIIPVLRFYDDDGNLVASHVGEIGKTHLLKLVNGTKKEK